MGERQMTCSKYPASSRAHYTRERSVSALHLCLQNQIDNHFSLGHMSMPLVVSCHWELAAVPEQALLSALACRTSDNSPKRTRTQISEQGHTGSWRRCHRQEGGSLSFQ